METNITTGQMTALLALLKQKKMTPDLFQRILEFGILSDVLDANAVLGNRTKIKRALGLFEEPKLVSVHFNDLPHGISGCFIEIEESLPLSQLGDYLSANGYAPLTLPNTQHLRDLAVALKKHQRGDCGIALIQEASSGVISTMYLCHAEGYRSGTTTNPQVLDAGYRIFVTTRSEK